MTSHDQSRAPLPTPLRSAKDRWCSVSQLDVWVRTSVPKHPSVGQTVPFSVRSQTDRTVDAPLTHRFAKRNAPIREEKHRIL